MCLSVKTSISEGNEVLAPLNIPLFILDECGDTSHNQSLVNPQLYNGFTLYKTPVVLEHDHCEDG
ncbi:hypothetical protein ACHQM5_020492 [Ranunculus cassubicifolius]